GPARVVRDDLRERLAAVDDLARLRPRDHPVGMAELRQGVEVVGGRGGGVAPDALLVRQLAHVRSIRRRDQWRKWRRAVMTIAAPACSTAWRTSASRTEPPGWTIAETPASSRSCGPSAKGKKASEAATVPLAPSGACS